MEQRFNIRTSNDEVIYTLPGSKGEGDMKIFTVFPKTPWAHSLCYIGHCMRLKGLVEDRRYPPAKGMQGRGKLMAFIHDCLYKQHLSIEEICKNHEIPD